MSSPGNFVRHHSYDEAIRALNGLQTNAAFLEKIRKERQKNVHLNLPKTLRYLDVTNDACSLVTLNTPFQIFGQFRTDSGSAGPASDHPCERNKGQGVHLRFYRVNPATSGSQDGLLLLSTSGDGE